MMIISIGFSSWRDEFNTEGLTAAMGFIWAPVTMIYILMTAVSFLLAAVAPGVSTIFGVLIGAIIGAIIEGALMYVFGEGVICFFEEAGDVLNNSALGSIDLTFAILSLLGSFILLWTTDLKLRSPEDQMELAGIWMALGALFLSFATPFLISRFNALFNNEEWTIWFSNLLSWASLGLSIFGLLLTLLYDSTTDKLKTPLYWWEEVTSGLALAISTSGFLPSLGDLFNYYDITPIDLLEFLSKHHENQEE